MERIELSGGQSLRREDRGTKWKVYSAEGNPIRTLDDFEDEMVDAAYVAGQCNA